jgi:NAD(P)-dependent dehydrogenase (short-subunit alcohol dehydrogenase family)
MGMLDGKVCVITGAAGVIGREAVDVFTREGATVAGVDVKGEVDAPFFAAADLTDGDQVAAMYRAVADRFGRIDVLLTTRASPCRRTGRCSTPTWQPGTG